MFKPRTFSRPRFLLTGGTIFVLIHSPLNGERLQAFPTAGSEIYAQLPSRKSLREGIFQPHYRLPSLLQSILLKTDPAKDFFPIEAVTQKLNQV